MNPIKTIMTILMELRQFRQTVRKQMQISQAQLDQLQADFTTLSTSVTNAAGRVSTDLGTLNASVADLKQQIAAAGTPVDISGVEANIAALNAMGVRNVLSVPLVAFTRGSDGHLLTRHPVGVLHVFNKSMGGDFTDEDVRLLQSLARIAVALLKAQRSSG